MKLVEKLSFMGGVTLLAAGCAAFTGGYPSGSIYSGTTVPHGVDRLEMAGQGKDGAKSGEACATGILNLAAFGDASVDAAKKAGQINDVTSVELRTMNILGIYTQGCTEVHGK
ncbi:MAG TPA: TRL-like family protein [Polyangiaceae bacterium]